MYAICSFKLHSLVIGHLYHDGKQNAIHLLGIFCLFIEDSICLSKKLIQVFDKTFNTKSHHFRLEKYISITFFFD